MKQTLFQLALAICLTTTLHAQTQVSGYILSNTTWTVANSPYIVTGNILVNNGVMLTIEPGVTVKFDTTKTLQVDGELIAIGNVQNRITFTSTDTIPARGLWGRIQFSNTCVDALFDTAGNYISGSILKYCDVLYGGGVTGDVTLYCDTSAPYFSNCRIRSCLKNAVRFVQAVGRVDSSSIRYCGGTAIEYSNPIPLPFIVMNDTIENTGGGIGRSGTGTFTSAIVQNCVFTSSGNAISNIAGSTNIIVENNTFTSNSIALHILIPSTIGSIISNNTFTTNLEVLQGSLGAGAVISNNTFIGNSKGVIGGNVCPDDFDFAVNHVVISDNLFQNNKSVIVMRANYMVVQNNIFQNNQFFYGSCPEIFGGGYWYYYDFIRLKSGQGLFINNIIQGTTSGANEPLIKLDGQLEIANNVIKNNSKGRIDCNTPVNLCSNKFLNNQGTVVSSINTSGTVYIHHNEFSNNAGAGSIITFSSNSSVNNNEFIGNTCSTNSSVIAFSGNSPAITYNKFTANSCAGNSAIISFGASSPVIVNNKFTDNLLSGNATIITNNNCASNIHNNDFLNNSGGTMVRIYGSPAQPVVTQNNFINPGVQYEIENQIPFGPGANINLANNYWGTTNIAHIDSVIKDYFDDANLSVALYPPVLTTPALVDTNATSCTPVVCALSISGTTVNPSCFGGADGSITVTLANGTVPYRFSWSIGGTAQSLSNLLNGTYTVTVVDSNFCSATKTFTLTQPASPVSIVSGVVTDATCNTGGTINIAAGGGTSPYTYNWGNGITTKDRTGLNTGSYTVTVTDSKGCTASQSFVIGQQSGPVISGAVTNTSCHNGCDGAINLSITGVAPFTYDWGNGFGTNEDTSGLCAGTYNVTVADSNNCGIAAVFTVTSPDSLIASAYSISSVSCFGYNDGAASTIVHGGTPPYNFLWSDGQTFVAAYGLSEGTYAVTVTDSLGCTDSASVYIPDGYQVFAGVIGGLSSVGVNQPASYIVSASPSYSYTWSVTNGNILNGQGTNTIEAAWTSAGTETIQLIAQEHGCADTVSKTVTVTDTTRNCSALFHLYPDTIPHSYLVITTASGISQLSYLWNWGDGTTDTAAYPSHTYSSSGFYTICLTITDSSGCSDTYCNPYFLLKSEGELEMIQVNVYPPSYTAIQDILSDNITFYPNPTNSTIVVRGIPSLPVTEPLTLILFDALGKEVWQQAVQPVALNDGVLIDMHQMHEGVYFLRLHTSGGSRVMKVVKY